MPIKPRSKKYFCPAAQVLPGTRSISGAARHMDEAGAPYRSNPRSRVGIHSKPHQPYRPSMCKQILPPGHGAAYRKESHILVGRNALCLPTSVPACRLADFQHNGPQADSRMPNWRMSCRPTGNWQNCLQIMTAMAPIMFRAARRCVVSRVSVR